MVPQSIFDLSEILVDEGYEIYPQELNAARNYVFFHDFEHHLSWVDWWAQIFFRLDLPPPPGTLVNKLKAPPMTLYEGVPETIRKLSQYQLSIVTTIPYFMLKDAIAPIEDQFVQIVTGVRAGCAKGNPKIYLFDLEHKKVPANENLFVGDDPIYDIKVPKNLGMTTVQICSDGEQVAEADYWIQNVNQIIDLLYFR